MLRPLVSAKSDVSLPQVRACLQHLGDSSFLAVHPLTAALGYGKLVGPSEKNPLRSALMQAVESLRPTGQSLGATRALWRYQALYQRYIEGQNVDAVCESLSVSQREFYRLLREGLEAVTELLALRPSGALPVVDKATSINTAQTFFGRQNEIERLIAEFYGVEQGQGGRALVLQGLPGIGKSRLLEELGSIVRNRGGIYLEGHMLQDARGPYDAWVEALAPSLKALPSAGKDALRAQSPALFSLLLTGEVPATTVEDSANQTDEAERRVAFYADVVRFLERVSSHKPVVLALDDLHWAPALTLFSYLVQRVHALRLLVIATIQECQSLDRPRVYDEVQALVRDRQLSVLDLPPLSRSETASLVAGRLGAGVNERLIDTIFERTLGNPFFAEELVRSIWERGDLEQRGAEWGLVERARLVIPTTVTATIEERVGRLSAGVREVLSTASVLGERFQDGLLGLMLDASESEMFAALEQALSLGLIIEEFIAGEEGYRFADPQVRDALYATIPVSMRRKVHLRARDVIERFYEDDIERHTQELARHYHLAGKLSEGAAHAFRSGEKAEALFAWGTATRWYEMSLSLYDQANGPLRRQAQVCLKLGKLYCQSSLDAAKGVKLLQRALAAFQEVGEPQFTAMTHLELARVRMTGFDLNEINFEEALSHLNAARSTLEKLPVAPGLAQVYLGLYTAHARLGEFDEGNEWVEKAREASAELEDPAVIADSVVSAAAYALISRGEVVRGSEMFEEAWEIASRECLPSSSDFCRQVASLILGISLKNPKVGLGWIKRQPDYGTRWLTLQSQVTAIYTLLGQFDKANEAFEELKVRLAEAGKPPFGLFPSDPGLFLSRSGRWEEALGLLTEGLAYTKAHKHHLSSVRTASVRGGLLLEMGELAGAEEDLQWAYETACNNHSVMNILKTAPALCELYVAQGRTAAAAVLLNEHWSLAQDLASFGGASGDLWLASARYYASLGDNEKAEARFEAAAELYERFALPWEQAQVATKWALSMPEPSQGRNELLQRATGL